MKKYYVKNGEFGNTYSLVYTSTLAESEKAIAAGYKRIPRKEAERLCARERERRREDSSFSGYADSYIYPYMDDYQDVNFGSSPWVRNGYLIERI